MEVEAALIEWQTDGVEQASHLRLKVGYNILVIDAQHLVQI